MTPNNNLSTIRYVLDTDTITYQQRGDATVLQRLSQIDPDHVATTVVSIASEGGASLTLGYRRHSPTEKEICIN